MTTEAVNLAVYDFGVNLIKNVEQPLSNVFLSPASITIVLGMCYFGAENNTKNQIKRTVFGNGTNDSDIKAYVLKLLSLAPSQPDSTSSLSFANRLYCRQDFDLRPDYQELLARDFRSTILPADFQHNGSIIEQEINEWVANSTNQRIQNLIPAHSLDPSTLLVLINALYFKDQWVNAFKPSNTKHQNFTVSQNETVLVEMMHQNVDDKLYGENNECQVLLLPYKETTVSMAFVLPAKGKDLHSFLQTLNGQKLKSLLTDVESADIEVAIPKFKFEQSFQLSKVLKQVGIEDAFRPDKADFSQIANLTTNQRILISEVYHKAFVDVNENGTEAAAATAAVLRLMALPVPKPKPKKFIADRPFLFALVADQDKAPLFLGLYNGK